NAHDQFLQTFACLGFLGGASLCLMLLVPFVKRPRDPLTLIFLALCILNALVESTLEVQGGVLFFSFFACVLLWNSPKDER
ncbi:MAG TPA: hypothetical protein PK760_15890, partial [Flavobacteriales bacterium]|nr:hypothetical protein [Flavobacteriales bacterium]